MKIRMNSYLTSARREKKARDLSSFSLKKSAPVSIHNLGAWELDSHNYL